MRRGYRHFTSLVLAAAIAAAPVHAQQNGCKIKPPATPQLGTAAAPAGPRIVDFRNVPQGRRASVLAKLKANEVPLVSRALLSDAAFIDLLRVARPPAVILESPDGLKAAQQLSRTVDGIQVISGIPRDAAEIKNVYGSSASASPAALKQMKRATERAARLPKAPSKGTLASTALSEAKRTDTRSALVLIVHNDGNHLRFPDGSSLTLTEFRAAAETSGRPEFVVSCDTAEILQQSMAGLHTTKRIDFANAADALHAARGERTLGDVLETFSKNYKSPEAQTQDRILVILMVGAVLIVIAILLTDDENGLVAAR